MVNTIQVNVKLQERRNEALKWELLRQGGSQEKFDSIAKEVSMLGLGVARVGNEASREKIDSVTQDIVRLCLLMQVCKKTKV